MTKQEYIELQKRKAKTSEELRKRTFENGGTLIYATADMENGQVYEEHADGTIVFIDDNLNEKKIVRNSTKEKIYVPKPKDSIF